MKKIILLIGIVMILLVGCKQSKKIDCDKSAFTGEELFDIFINGLEGNNTEEYYDRLREKIEYCKPIEMCLGENCEEIIGIY